MNYAELDAKLTSGGPEQSESEEAREWEDLLDYADRMIAGIPHEFSAAQLIAAIKKISEAEK